MIKEFVPYQPSFDMKELGFDEPCFGFYCDEGNRVEPHYPCDGLNKAPLYQQAFRWLLKEHNLYAVIIPTITMYWTFKTMTVVEGMVEVPPYKHVDAYDYTTREEAELECLKKLIEIVKK
jgi:hypothetical protein